MLVLMSADLMLTDLIMASSGAALSAGSSKSAAEPVAAAAAAAPAIVPLPISLVTMARQARKIVATLPTSARVAVLGAQGSGRSSLINLLSSATNPAPNDPRQIRPTQDKACRRVKAR